ncbi:MAG: hypothetical protein K9L30_13960 [Desulfobacterales bacterium]|nr:hypothetical protein [Desulfobacterales bacterium]
MILKLKDIQEKDRSLIGGKGYALSILSRYGFNVPRTLFITADVYLDYLKATGLQERILLALHRKNLKEMRWEEVWDTALRIRNMFLTKDLPDKIKSLFSKAIKNEFGDISVVVRSSAPDEDSAAASFAGLHESYVNITGIDNILTHIKLVWASLWSDAALLYRQELGLDVENSSMAVVVQEVISGSASGVIFSKNPNDDSQILIESVHGLNQGLVDGIIEPDRWEIDRNSKTIISHYEAAREQWMMTASDGIRCETLPQEKINAPPINKSQCKTLADTVLKSESVFGSPQDMEWTFRDNKLYILQSRPITTTGTSNTEDKRSWYLSLKKSFDNLQGLRHKIEGHLIPDIIRIAETLKNMNLTGLSDDELSVEIQNRYEINNHWIKVYWDEFIPFAHGVRIFGQFYNDTIRPVDPYEFVDLLKNSRMISLERNRMLEELSAIVQADQNISSTLIAKKYSELGTDFQNKAYAYIEAFGNLSCSVSGGKECEAALETLLTIVLEMSRHNRKKDNKKADNNIKVKEEAFLNHFSEDKRQQAKEYLDLARVSYQLRDDDNIHLERIEAQWRSAVHEGKKRKTLQNKISLSLEKTLSIMPDQIEKPESTTPESTGHYNVKARQLLGQAAGPGIATGTARVFTTRNDLAGFKHGEILICDAVDPTMTFVIPLTAGIVEKRGGMLIHGAIIAREYGIPCVTGVSDVTKYIKTGDTVTVDGYLGIVTLK